MNCFSCHCNQTPGKRQLKRKWLVLFTVQRDVYSSQCIMIAGTAWLKHQPGSRERRMLAFCWLSPFSPLVFYLGLQPTAWSCTNLQRGPSSSVKLCWNNSHRDTQRCASWTPHAVFNLTKLSIKVNPYKWYCPKGSPCKGSDSCHLGIKVHGWPLGIRRPMGWGGGWRDNGMYDQRTWYEVMKLS